VWRGAGAAATLDLARAIRRFGSTPRRSRRCTAPTLDATPLRVVLRLASHAAAALADGLAWRVARVDAGRRLRGARVDWARLAVLFGARAMASSSCSVDACLWRRATDCCRAAPLRAIVV
jgi:hypothetical protein